MLSSCFEIRLVIELILLFFITQPQSVAIFVTLQMYENINLVILFSEKNARLMRLQKNTHGGIESLGVFVGDKVVAFYYLDGCIR